MSEYEASAFESVDALRGDQLAQLNDFRENYAQTASRYLPSKNLIHLRKCEYRAFNSKKYDESVAHAHQAEQLELLERDQHY